jgi:hypothetical protein
MAKQQPEGGPVPTEYSVEILINAICRPLFAEKGEAA